MFVPHIASSLKGAWPLPFFAKEYKILVFKVIPNPCRKGVRFRFCRMFLNGVAKVLYGQGWIGLDFFCWPVFNAIERAEPGPRWDRNFETGLEDL